MIEKTQSEIGLIPAEDSHSILLSIARGLKSNHTRVHPVTVAPLCLSLIKRVIFSDDSPFRTKAGVFGFVSRLGIDWTRHLSCNMRETVIMEFCDAFKAVCESSASADVDSQALGFCAETAFLLGLECDELTAVLSEKMIQEALSMPPLALVQISKYLSFHEPDLSVWESIAQRLERDIHSFSAQNLVSLLCSFQDSGVSCAHLIEKVCEFLPTSSATMGFNDCVSSLECISLADPYSIPSEKVVTFARSVQRRITILMVSSKSPVLSTQIARILESMKRLALPPISPLVPFISSPNAQFQIS